MERGKLIAVSSTVIAFTIAVGGGLVALIRGETPQFDAMLGVLTATLMAAIWYTYFTYRSIEQTKKLADRERTEARASLSTAMLGELQWLSRRLRVYFDDPDNYSASIAHPILDEAIRNAILFKPETVRQLTDVHRLLDEVESAIERRDTGAGNHWVKPFAGSAVHQLVDLVESLKAEGGRMPRRLWPRYESEVEPLPDDPFPADSLPGGRGANG